MKRLLNIFALIIVFGMTSCSEDSNLENHLLVGDYTGNWCTNEIKLERKFSIEYEEIRDGLVLFYSLADSSDLNIISDTEFTIDRYVQNSYSNGVSGILVGDTLYLENQVYLVSDSIKTSTLRTGVFVKQ